MADPSKTENSDLFAGRGKPAYMSQKEAALRILRERYSESFAMTEGVKENQIHLFLVKLGLWALVWTFTPKDFEDTLHPEVTIQSSLDLIDKAFSKAESSLQLRLDEAVKKAIERIRLKALEFGVSES